MPRIVREAEISWERSPARGSGTLAAAEAADRGCPFSALLRAAGACIDTTTALEGGD